MYYVKALHIIFVITWFSGMFYFGRLLIYLREAQDKKESAKQILTEQLTLMSKRLLFGIAFPSAMLTLIFGTWLITYYHTLPQWLNVKLVLVFFLYLYHFSLHYIFAQQRKNNFKFSSYQLRIWNEVPTVFLVSIVFLAVAKSSLSMLYGLIGLAVFIVVLMSAIVIYRKIRAR